MGQFLSTFSPIYYFSFDFQKSLGSVHLPPINVLLSFHAYQVQCHLPVREWYTGLIIISHIICWHQIHYHHYFMSFHFIYNVPSHRFNISCAPLCIENHPSNGFSCSWDALFIPSCSTTLWVLALVERLVGWKYSTRYVRLHSITYTHSQMPTSYGKCPSYTHILWPYLLWLK